MIIPIRCFTCGKPIAQDWEEFEKRSKKEKTNDVLDSLGYTRYCCRRMFIAHCEIIDETMQYKKF
ncbi:MAG: DNA-directed RNA polymerase subunit N [Candidatus Altiarchaeales archaeon IMC4]|nr:MAG: DNA-directed RNA polymerase subunit N [Candidatus Altiarchaeales archaeon IMC4]